MEKAWIYTIGGYGMIILTWIKYSDAMIVGALILFVISFAENEALTQSKSKAKGSKQ